MAALQDLEDFDYAKTGLAQLGWRPALSLATHKHILTVYLVNIENHIVREVIARSQDGAYTIDICEMNNNVLH